MTRPAPPAGLTELTLKALQDESLRAHGKHTREGGKSMLDTALDTDLRLAAIGEELGEVCRAYIEYPYHGQAPLVIELIQLANTAASWAQSLTAPGAVMLTDYTLASIQQCPVTWHLNHISDKLSTAHKMLTLLGQLFGALSRANDPLLSTSHLRTRLLQLANAAATWAQDLERAE
jgi:hypothetical protein